MKIGHCSSTGVSEKKKIHPSSRLFSEPSLNLIWFHHKKRQAVLVKLRDYISMRSGWDKDKSRTNRASMELSTLSYCYTINVNLSQIHYLKNWYIFAQTWTIPAEGEGADTLFKDKRGVSQKHSTFCTMHMPQTGQCELLRTFPPLL